MKKRPNRLPNDDEILVFGARSIPQEVILSQKYEPHIVMIGEDYLWGPLLVDIKPLYYTYLADALEDFFDLESWIDQAITRFMVSFSEIIQTTDPEHTGHIIDRFENSLYCLLFPCSGYEM